MQLITIGVNCSAIRLWGVIALKRRYLITATVASIILVVELEDRESAYALFFYCLPV
jgi:hypothetical protein